MKTKRPAMVAFVLLILLLVAAGGGWLCKSIGRAKEGKFKLTGKSESSTSSLSNLLALRSDALQGVDIAQMNLLCAQGLPGAEGLDVNRCLTALDEMADRVRSETERHLYRFRQNQSEFENSEGYFRMIMLAVVLAEDFHVKYAPNKIGTAVPLSMDKRLARGDSRARIL